ncbi:MAG: iron complex outermembrane receptor protein [Gammaproteobacteria bacterium]|jgi:iron complex outermembrane receptor protein
MQSPIPHPYRGLLALSVLLAFGSLSFGSEPAGGDDPVPAAFSSADPADPADPVGADGDLTELSIEDLLGIEVTIASRSSQSLSEVPGAVYVLTGDEIRRSGHSSVQEALRMVPGFYVSRWQTSSWDVTSRGFGSGVAYTNQAYINQLLVLVDGVVVYTPLFPGVWWSLQDLDMGQVERIEIIRGPGGILWGANAVHGVVHVITKNAHDTLGVRVSGRASEDERHVAVSSGSTFGENGAVRMWVKNAHYDALEGPAVGIDDSFSIDSIGGRADWTDSRGNEWMAWARAYEADVYEIGFDLVGFFNYRALTKKHGYQAHVQRTNPENDSTWQASYVSDQQDRPTYFNLRIDTVDLEYRKGVYNSENLDIQAGAAWRHIQSDFVGDDVPYWDFSPHEVSLDTLRAFSLATYTFDDPAWSLLAGVSIENNELTDWEVQPTVRVSWAPDEDSLAWAGVSRAVRTPSLEERFSTPTGFLAGDPDFDSEEVISYEMGYREIITEELSADVAIFFNQYDDLRVEVLGGAGNIITVNEGEASTHGAEVAVDWKPSDKWSVRSAYSFETGDYEFKPTGENLGTEEESPKHSGSIRSFYDISEAWELDLGIYAVEGLGDFLRRAEYVRADMRLGYRPNENFNIYAGIQGMTQDNWTEYDPSFGTRRTSLFFGMDWTP